MYTSMSSKVYPSRTSTDLQQSKVSQFTSSIEFVESSSNSTPQPSSRVAILSSSNVIRTEPLTTTLPLSTTFLSPSVTGVQSSPSAFTRSSVDSKSVVLSSGVINQQSTDKVVYVPSSISSFSTDFLPETQTSKSSGYSTDLMPLIPSDDTSTETKISTNIEIKPSSELFFFNVDFSSSRLKNQFPCSIIVQIGNNKQNLRFVNCNSSTFEINNNFLNEI